MSVGDAAPEKAAAWWPRIDPAARDLGAGAVLLVIGCTLAATVPDYRAQEWALWVIYGLLALSFTFVWGHAGIFSFGQAAFFGVGGYAFGITGINLSFTTNESLTGLVAAGLVSGVFAAALGYFIFYGNVGDVYVAIITLAVTLVLLTVMSSTADPKYHVGAAALGGYNGLIGVPPLMVPGGDGPVLLGSNALLAACVVIAVTVAVLLSTLRRRPFGRVVAGVRENELRTSLLGYDVRRYKLMAFVIGGVVAGLAGGLYAAWGQFINPAVFGLQSAALVAIWVLVGGRTSILGAFVGVALVQGLSSTLGGSGGTTTPIVLGAVLIAVVLILPNGLVPTAATALRRLAPSLRAPSAPAVDGASSSLGELRAVLSERTASLEPQSVEAQDLHKSFGGVQALRGASLSLPARTVQCLIGPNGAGKSTCFNLLSGRYRPTKGQVRLGATDITRLRPDQRARLGMGIKLQVPSYFAPLTTFENVWLAAYARLRAVREADARAAAILAGLGLASKSGLTADTLSHGEHQWLEIGMVVAGEPIVILLDEPTAGMSREETLRTVELVRALATDATVVVVEHDMEFVRVLNAPVTMFHEGRVFARGSIAELRADERVLDIYLGRTVAADAAG